MTIPSYPLAWPDMQPRTPAGRRSRSPFRTTYPNAVKNVADSLRLFQKDAGVRIDHVVLSSNVDLIRSAPSDPGACAWFQMDGDWIGFGVDRFSDVAANVQAIHHIVEARRVELRYGGLVFVRQTFKAFRALPAPQSASWWSILRLEQSASREEIEAAFRRLARERHPDRGGSDAMMADLNRARDEALRSRS